MHRSREVELTLEAHLLDLKLARLNSERERAEQLASTLRDAAIARGHAAILAKIAGD